MLKMVCKLFLNGYFTNDVLKDLMNYLQKECPEIEVIDSFIAFSPTFKSHDIAIRIFLKKGNLYRVGEC
ncbi:hypothetical protein ACU82A_30390 [Bacillus cereus]